MRGFFLSQARDLFAPGKIPSTGYKYPHFNPNHAPHIRVET
jgi:hypothetical protein